MGKSEVGCSGFMKGAGAPFSVGATELGTELEADPNVAALSAISVRLISFI
jgi:hypothetical protein